MGKDRVLQILRDHEPDLRKAGVSHLRLFGSVARGDETPESDIDIAVTMDSSRRWTLFTVGGVQMDLSDMLGTTVDVALLEGLRTPIRDRVMSEGIDVF